jgi:hypothetical protein
VFLRKVLALSQILRVIVKPFIDEYLLLEPPGSLKFDSDIPALGRFNLYHQGRRSLSASQMSLRRGVDFRETGSFELSV